MHNLSYVCVTPIQGVNTDRSQENLSMICTHTHIQQNQSLGDYENYLKFSLALNYVIHTCYLFMLIIFL